jgi:branched-chain amino acid transport system permease protein
MQARQSLLDARRWRWWEWLFWLFAFASPALLSTHALILNEMAIVALFAVSLDLILGFCGIVSLGHAAYFGLGAYGAALFAKHIYPDPLVGLLFAMLVALVAGWLGSFTILRGSDLTRLMVTLGVASILLELANKLDDLTGGADGLQGVVIDPIAGRFEFDLMGQTPAWYSITVLFVLFVLLRKLVHSPLGATFKAVKDNALRAKAVGIHVNARVRLIYTLAAGVAGVAGALMSQTTGFASLDVFSMDRSADVMLMLVMGGVGWLYGGIVGAVTFKLMYDVIASITPQYWTFWMGLFLVVLMRVGRERLFRPWLWWRSSSKELS